MSDLAPWIAPLVAGGWGLKRVVGPTLDMWGKELAAVLGPRRANVERIVDVANEIAADDDRYVHPRVVHQALEEASWLDDDVMRQYAGGFLAASRTEDGQEQRGAAYLSILTRLTPLQIRLHYLIYTAARTLPVDVTEEGQVPGFCVWHPLSGAGQVLGIDGDESEWLIREALDGLDRDDLIASHAVGDVDELRRGNAEAEVPAFVSVVSPLGAVLYLWAHGERTANPNRLRGFVPRRPLDQAPDPSAAFLAPYSSAFEQQAREIAQPAGSRRRSDLRTELTSVRQPAASRRQRTSGAGWTSSMSSRT